MPFAGLERMRQPPGSGPAPPRRWRRILIALLILLLILLPLYLWPLRAGVGGLPDASALPGRPRDPRDTTALAAIPADVWDDLMGRTPPRPTAPRNLTMIAKLDEIAAAGPFDFGEPEYSHPGLAGSPSLGRLTSDELGGGTDSSGGESGFGESSPAPAQSIAALGGTGGQGSGSGWGGYPGLANLGPWGGGGGFGGRGSSGPSSDGPGPIWDPSDSPTPTPEPTTIVLIGSNLMFFGAAAWKRRRREKGSAPAE